MDLFTANAAHSLHAQDAQRAARELEYRRVAKERAALTQVDRTSAATTIPVRVKRTHGLLFTLLHGHRATAQ